jgi:hypothetical protein
MSTRPRAQGNGQGESTGLAIIAESVKVRVYLIPKLPDLTLIISSM